MTTKIESEAIEATKEAVAAITTARQAFEKAIILTRASGTQGGTNALYETMRALERLADEAYTKHITK